MWLLRETHRQMQAWSLESSLGHAGISVFWSSLRNLEASNVSIE